MSTHFHAVRFTLDDDLRLEVTSDDGENIDFRMLFNLDKDDAHELILHFPADDLPRVHTFFHDASEAFGKAMETLRPVLALQTLEAAQARGGDEDG